MPHLVGSVQPVAVDENGSKVAFALSPDLVMVIVVLRPSVKGNEVSGTPGEAVPAPPCMKKKSGLRFRATQQVWLAQEQFAFCAEVLTDNVKPSKPLNWLVVEMNGGRKFNIDLQMNSFDRCLFG